MSVIGDHEIGPVLNNDLPVLAALFGIKQPTEVPLSVAPHTARFAAANKTRTREPPQFPCRAWENNLPNSDQRHVKAPLKQSPATSALFSDSFLQAPK